jgi:hypothetical protein
VIANATQLHQVVMNLCSNAIQAMRGGGILRVMLETAELSAERALSHGTLETGGYLRLIVEDSGCGMEEATLSRIFEPFFTTKKAGEGTGLGLSLVYAIVTDLGGAIDVKSAPQQGTTFTIYLPRSEVPLATVESGPGLPPRGHGERVLLIEDEEPVLAAATHVLSRLGYEAVSFSDSHAALAAFKARARAVRRRRQRRSHARAHRNGARAGVSPPSARLADRAGERPSRSDPDPGRARHRGQ